MSKTNIRNKAGEISMIELGNAIPITIAKGLVGAVAIPAIAAYSAVEGLAVGGMLGNEYGKAIAGKKYSV